MYIVQESELYAGILILSASLATFQTLLSFVYVFVVQQDFDIDM